MTNKYKVSDLAKDFKVSSKDIIDIVAEKTGAVKKSGASLDETEISLVFNTLRRGEKGERGRKEQKACRADGYFRAA